MKQFSKRMLALDYIITGLFIIMILIMSIINACFVSANPDATQALFDFGTIGIIFSAWIGQLAISSGAYYWMCKADHSIELPIRMINELPEDVKERVDMDNLISSVLSNTNN